MAGRDASFEGATDDDAGGFRSRFILSELAGALFFVDSDGPCASSALSTAVDGEPTFTRDGDDPFFPVDFRAASSVDDIAPCVGKSGFASDPVASEGADEDSSLGAGFEPSWSFNKS